MSVHVLGPRLPEFQKWLPQTDTFWTLHTGVSSTQTYRNHFLNGILQADQMIQQIFQVLRDKNVLDHSLVIITADHGEYLGEFGRLGHGGAPYEPVVHIPLIIYDPLAGPYPVRPIASQVDIAPTFLYAIGVPIPAHWAGIPLQVATTRNAVSVASREASGVVDVIDGRKYKYLLYPQSGREELFDLESPAGEKANLVLEPSAQSLLSKLRAVHTQMTHKDAVAPSQP